MANALNKKIEEFLLERGAIKVGFTNAERLAGGPPSTDLEYKLKGARSAISFSIPFNREYIRLYLSKKDRALHEKDNLDGNQKVYEMSWDLANMLKSEGHTAKGTRANNKYRQEIEGWQLSMPPDISHRYLAVVSGAGSFGWSGNVGVKGHGAAIILGTCITSAKLEPTDPEPEEESYCDNCKLCSASCPVGTFSKKEEESISIGGVTFKHSARSDRSYILCQFCCGGFTGLHKSGKWSSWSPGRFSVPEDNTELGEEFFRSMSLYAKRPKMPGGYNQSVFGDSKEDMKLNLTCGNCQIICWGDKKETAENVKLLRNSGCTMQKPDGTLYALPAEEAVKEFNALPEDYRSLFQ